MMTLNEPATNRFVISSDEERAMLRDALRGALESWWPADRAVEAWDDRQQVRTAAMRLAEFGVTRIGLEPEMGGLRDFLVVAQELGRAACPVALLSNFAVLRLLQAVRQRDNEADTLINSIGSGEAFVGLSLGGADGDATAGRLHLSGGLASGELRYLDTAAGITAIVAKLDDGRLALIEDVSKIEVVPTRSFGAATLGSVRVSGASARIYSIDQALWDEAALFLRLGLAARALGAADRSFEMAVDYAKEREQFGQPIGRFQAIQHKLANGYIALETVRQALDGAAAQYDGGFDEWDVLAQAAVAFASPALRHVSLETHHAFGAIGYAEDHEAPRHFKRVHQDTLRNGAGRRAREALARRFLDEKRGFPDYDLGPEGNLLRREVKAWLSEHWPEERRARFEAEHMPHAYDREFARELGETGWLGLNWGKEYGGQGRSPIEYYAFLQETIRAAVPRAGSQVQAVAWMLYGTAEQKAEYLPPLLRGEVNYGMFYSEPNSGSDLASLQTRAVRDGDEYVINGQKIWTTTYFADYLWLAARTDQNASPAHKGISMFCVPKDTPGFTTNPVATMYDGEFSNSFFDDMRVPAECLVGQLNGGWKVLMGSLGAERGFAGAHMLLEAAHLFELACDYIAQADRNGVPLKDDPVVRDTIGRLAAELEAGRRLGLHCIEETADRETPPALAAASKIFAGELVERMCESLQEIIGMEASLSRHAEGAILEGKIEQKLRNSLMYVISMGTNEIQRNIIAQRGLGLPR